MKQLLTVGIVAIVLNNVLCTGSAQAQGWPEVFEPNQLLTLNLQMDPGDWNTIRHDLTFDIEVPASLWADGESPILVSVRRKSCQALPDESDPNKVSLKIDINEYISGQKWHDLNKLSLENGDDVDVVSEGLTCNLHRMAAGPEGYGYDAWRANWVKVYVNGVYKGVYTSAEQRDKQFLRNRNLYVKDQVWLYKQEGRGDFVLKVGDDANSASPAVLALCYEPFACTIYSGPLCPIPDDANLIADMNEWVNVQGMLTMEAINTFMANMDTIFNHYKNGYFLDFNLDNPAETRKRMYLPWDVDSVMASVDRDIYEGPHGLTLWQQLILGNPVFRSQYNQIMRDLLNGPLSEAKIYAFLNMVEPVLTDALAEDPYNQFTTPGVPGVQERFDEIRAWISDRIVNVLDQVDFDEPLPPPGIVLLQDGFEGAVWDANWVSPHNWLKDTTTYAHGTASAWADENNNGDFTCDALDTSDAAVIHIRFWFMKYGTDVAEDLLLYYYNGTNYIFIADLDTLGGDDVWLRYTDTITDSNYFVPNFRIRFNSTPETGENVWIDDVVVTKQETVTVPDVVGLTETDAGTAITAVGLIVGNVTYANSSTVPAGLVISQVPVAGTSVETGSAVDFVISLGPVMVDVPDVVGLTLTAAETTVTAVGLTVGNVTYEYSNTVAVGFVISQNPSAGTSVEIGSTVDIVVSLGQPVVPDVVGLTLTAAETTVTAVGLTVGNVTYEYSNTVAAGLVISQNPSAGTSVLIGSAVDLVISLGPPMVTVPDVVGLTQTDAETAIAAVGLTVGNVTYANSSTVPAGLVISQNPSAGTSVQIGSAVDLVISLGPAPRIILLQDGFEGEPWDAHWDEIAHNWMVDTTVYFLGLASAKAKKNNLGYFTCDALDTSDANAIDIDFWFRKDDTEPGGDFLLYYYNGTSYNLIADLDTLGGDDVWLHYTNTITDTQYFVSNFRIRFDATPEVKENVWIDDVVVTKEMSSGCDLANLDGINPVNFKDFVILAGDWQLTGPDLDGDINRDRLINLEDLAQIAQYWLMDCSQL